MDGDTPTDINLKPAYLCCYQVPLVMKKQEQLVLITVTPISGIIFGKLQITIHNNSCGAISKKGVVAAPKRNVAHSIAYPYHSQHLKTELGRTDGCHDWEFFKCHRSLLHTFLTSENGDCFAVKGLLGREPHVIGLEERLKTCLLQYSLFF